MDFTTEARCAADLHSIKTFLKIYPPVRTGFGRATFRGMGYPEQDMRNRLDSAQGRSATQCQDRARRRLYPQFSTVCGTERSLFNPWSDTRGMPHCAISV